MARTTKTTRRRSAKTAKRKRTTSKKTTRRPAATKTARAGTRSTPRSTAARKGGGTTTSRRATARTTAPSRPESTQHAAPPEATAASPFRVEEHTRELSGSARRAKWIDIPEEHEDRPGQTLATRTHDVIMAWANARGAKPATVRGTEHGGRTGVLRLRFPGDGGNDLVEIGWDEWFEPFDARQLVFLFREHEASGERSDFFNLEHAPPEHG